MIDETMKTLTEELIARGTSYDIDFLRRVYADDLKFVRILPDNTVQILSNRTISGSSRPSKTAAPRP